MKNKVVEELYPINFRGYESKELGELLRNRRSVVLVGMKRVGISNFLRFFLNHKDVKKTYINEDKHIFISIDLNDLVEREIFPFWILTFKRISDFVNENIENNEIKKRVSQLFLDSIQTQELFLTIDGIRESLNLLIKEDYKPTIFFLRFDRIIEASTHSFFSNIQGLIDSTDRKLSFVFTSVRPLDALTSEIFSKQDISVFADTIYIKPEKKEDAKIVLSTTQKSYGLSLPDNIEDSLLYLVDGYNQYLQFALIALREEENIPTSTDEISQILLTDERIMLQSEELWESLNKDEKIVLNKIITQKKLTDEDTIKGNYLFKTGLISSDNKIFSPLFEHFLYEKLEEKQDNHTLELSKKEQLLLGTLEKKINDVCEREEIITKVWPEAESLGVSDWAIDRLIARLRNKLKHQSSGLEIVTIKTRGYKLIKNI